MLHPAPGPQRPQRPQLDFFHKLGYSTAQVQAVQRKLGTDTDKVLGELVRIGAGRELEQRPVTTVSVLVPRGAPKAGAPQLLLPVKDPPSQNRENEGEDAAALRAVVIDGSNVAMSHGNKEVFSCLGIQLAVNYFLQRGHSEVTVFVPSWRKEQPRPDVPITDQHILRELEKKKILVFTPSRRVAGRRVVCNDDSFIVKHAFESDGVVVSNDLFRDLQGLNLEWKRFIEERLLMFSFVNNKFMLPDDPLGRHGPTLDNFLRKFPKTQKKQPCPHGRKCTYGTKCRFHHPARTKQRQPGVPEPSLSLVEDIPRKLNLGPRTTSLEKYEHVGQARQNQRPGRKSQTRKDKTSQQSDHGSVKDRSSLKDQGSMGVRGSEKDMTSQDQLDSGLGSIDSQLVETMWSHQQYGSSNDSVQQKLCPPSSTPCSCCSPGPFQPPSLVPRTDVSPYSPPPYPSCCMVPLSQPAFGQHSRLHPQRPFWSDPVCVCPSEAHVQPRQLSLLDRPPSPSGMERAVVRKNLLAIFSAQLVDAVMSMSPDQLDPQRLVADILVLQTQNWSLR